MTKKPAPKVNRKKKWVPTKREQVEIRRLIQDGSSYATIAKKVGRYPDAIRNWCIKNGCESVQAKSVQARSDPKRLLRKNHPDLKAIAERVAEKQGVDPLEATEALLTILTQIATGSMRSVLSAHDERYEGMPDMGLRTVQLGKSDIHSLALSKAASEEKVSLRDITSLVKDLAKLRLEQARFSHPVLSAKQIEVGGEIDLKHRPTKELVDDLRSILDGED